MKRGKMKICQSLLMASMFFSANTNAAQITPAVVPKNLHVYSLAGNAYVDLVSFECSGTRFLLEYSHRKYDAIFSLLLSAQLAKKKVKLRIDGCNANNQGKIIGAYLVE